MAETPPASRTERGIALIARLDAAEARLAVLAAVPGPPGRTDPAPGAEETWSAAQVWGHLSEFPAYWTAQARSALVAPADRPARVGRGLDDEGRLAPIRAAEEVPIPELFARCQAGLVEAQALAITLGPDDWDRIGEHPIRGPLTVGHLLEANIAGHLDEHTAQLERLAAEAATG